MKEGFLLHADGQLYRAAVVDGAELLLLDGQGIQLQRLPLFPHAAATIKLGNEVEPAVSTTAQRHELRFDVGDEGTHRFLEFLSTLSGFFGVQPDRLHYVLSAGGRKWLEPVEFEPRTWKFVLDKLREAKGWEVSGHFEGRDWQVEVKGSSKNGGAVLVRSDAERIDKLRALYDKLGTR